MPATTPSRVRPGLLPPGQWSLDLSRSRIEFGVRKRGAGTVHGRFSTAVGDVTVVQEGTWVRGSARVASIRTGSDERDAHLRELFDAKAHPEITFAAGAVVPRGDGAFCVRGELTIRGRTHEVELVARADGARRISAQGEIDRRDFGLTWNRAIEATSVVSTAIQVELDLCFAPG